MLERLQQVLVSLAARAGAHAFGQAARRSTVLLARMLRAPAMIAKNLEGLRDTMQLHGRETGSWVEAGQLVKQGGPFDACDLRCWVSLAEKAGVPVVPAHEILRLTHAEMDELSGKVKMPHTPVTRANGKGSALLDEHAEVLAEIADGLGANDHAGDRDELVERLYAAMDNVPEGWMVRNARVGSIELKALAGAGAIGEVAPEVRFGPDLEIGPGWIRDGNRRRVHVGDHRTVEAVARGPAGPTAFLARPWVKAARYLVSDDPHRHGTQFAGKGVWPAEWRAFVEDGAVVGVSWYYGWCGSVTPENARMALEVRRKAQLVIDVCAQLSAWPRYMDVEFVRSSGNPAILEDEEVRKWLEVFGREKISCTLDFIETEADGAVLLEGGPANTPFGGGHPCAFAGNGGPPRFGRKTVTHGVAFDMMEGVLLGDTRTWAEKGSDRHILTWEEVAALAG